MSSKVVGWLVGDWDGKFHILKKNLKEKKIFCNKSEKGESYIFARLTDSTLSAAEKVLENTKVFRQHFPLVVLTAFQILLFSLDKKNQFYINTTTNVHIFS